MNYKKLVLILVLGGLSGSMAGMEEAVKVNTVEIELKDGKKAVSVDIFDRFKGVIDPGLKLELEKRGAPYGFPSISKAQFELILNNLEAIEAGTIEELLIELNKEDRSKLLSLIDAANYLNIDAIMSLFKKIFGEGGIIASIYDKPDLVKALLIPQFIRLYNIDLDKQAYGTTALIWATREGHKDIVKMLLDAGADVNKQDKEGFTAFIWARLSNKKNIESMLIEAGATQDIIE